LVSAMVHCKQAAMMLKRTFFSPFLLKGLSTDEHP